MTHNPNPPRSRFGRPAVLSGRQFQQKTRPILPPLPTSRPSKQRGPVRGSFGLLEMVRPRIARGAPGVQRIPISWTINQWSNRPTKGFQPIHTIRDAHWRVKWVISSHVNYAKSREALIKALLRFGVPSTHLHVTLAASDAWRHEIRSDGVFMSHVRENMYEYTGMLDAARLYAIEDLDYIYLLHDTIVPDSSIQDRMLNQPAIYCDFLPIRNSPQFNMGLLRLGFLQRIQPWLEALDGVSKITGIDIELNRNGREGLWSKAKMVFPFLPGHYVDLGLEDVWGSGHKRHHFYMPGAGIHKFFYPTFDEKKAIYTP